MYKLDVILFQEEVIRCLMFKPVYELCPCKFDQLKRNTYNISSHLLVFSCVIF